jgi:predicted nucleotidyltransferase component of viral defense system
MLNIDELKKYYPSLQGFERGILREYLQYKILNIIFKSDFGRKLSFLGGTAIKICYDGFRFSEDLDFDNFTLSKKEFSEMTALIKKELTLEGYDVEVREVYKGAYHVYLKFSNILFDNKLSPMPDEKIMIQIDTVEKSFDYKSDNFLLSKFDIFRNINLTPVDVLLSQKIGAIFGRKKAKGRDFYDVSYLLGRHEPNYEYLNKKFKIKNKEELKKKLLARANQLNLKELSKDVLPFLINPDEAERILSFKEYIEQKL